MNLTIILPKVFKITLMWKQMHLRVHSFIFAEFGPPFSFQMCRITMSYLKLRLFDNLIPLIVIK